ncbi:archaemetzincin-2-like [Haliotis rubra]|uniref:archaemetzincin-2-like n=1 Tax=Haliotis rubra TaxID=36100 RepID=UPI001EE5BF63|nr:archaemetzincin-2-like [Haliotis rubra]
MNTGKKTKTGKIKSTSKKPPRCVPYIRGFKAPSEKERTLAIGFDVKNIPPAYNHSDTDFFTHLSQPTSVDDWLAQYKEDGQSFRGFLWQVPWLTLTKSPSTKVGKTLSEKYPKGKIYIVPVGKFDEESCFAFEDLIDYTGRFLCVPVATLPGLNLQRKEDKIVLEAVDGECELESRYSEESKHLQLSISSVLPILHDRVPEDAICVIGLTMYDLYGEDSDLFMAGLASASQKVAVFSIFRYDPKLTFSTEFWYDIKETEDVSDKDRKRMVLQRSCKLVVHEICHLLRIDHCIYFDCCMNGSGHLAEDFRQPMHLCPVDLHKLQVLTGMDVTNRYEKLLEFYKKHGMESEAEWVNRRILFIHGKEPKQAKKSAWK